jgi:hypothetical protein
MNDGIACHLQGMENGGTQQSSSGLKQYPEQGLVAFSPGSDIPRRPDFQRGPSHPPLSYSVEARPSDFHL